MGTLYLIIGVIAYLGMILITAKAMAFGLNDQPPPVDKEVWKEMQERADFHGGPGY